MNEKYVAQDIEKKWQQYWEDNHTFKTEYDESKEKYYVLEMFPYPSGNLHMGHVRNYSIGDVVARFKKMKGFNVLHPMGWDSFGMPAENAAIKHGIAPKTWTLDNIENMKLQQKALGLSYDWDREVATCKEDYYKWTQWFFEQFYKKGLAYKKEAKVNWCETCHTVLANEQVIDGACWRCDNPVEKKDLSQWFLRITEYADRLLTDLDTLDHWPQRVKLMQKNWIGRSEGTEFSFEVPSINERVSVYTTRVDTIYGVSYVVLAPEHPYVERLIENASNKAELEAFITRMRNMSDIDRTSTDAPKEGMFTGSYAVNPMSGEQVPVWIANYVLVDYGTGAVMGSPAHDERDYAFAKKFGLEIIPVLAGGDVTVEAWTQDGLHINSEWLDGLNKQEAIDKMIEWLESNHIGQKKINYKIREWIFARQRYWGEPIPVVHLEDDRYVAISDEELPLVLPVLDDYKPSKGGQSPLAKDEEWVNVTVDGIKGKRETSTMPGSAGSSWYFLRYIDPKNDKAIADPELLKHWMPVDLYVGGPEHAVGHLLYSRMWNRYLYDKGIVTTKEPFQKLVHQGMILGANGIKMGKRYPEFAIDPNALIEQYGADTVRLYEMFMGPLEASKPWSEQGVDGAHKWLERVHRLIVESNKISDINDGSLDEVYHATVKKVTSDIESLNLNTAISQMMIFINECYKADTLYKPYMEGFVQMFACYAPHLGEELWQFLGHENTLTFEAWPTYDESKLVKNQVEMVVQVNGKVRGKFMANIDEDKKIVEEMALALPSVQAQMEGKTVRKLIIVPNRIVNIVVG